MAFTSLAALAAAGTEAVTATMVLGAIAEVGTAMTVVGAVTGSKDLMKIGGIMGIAGGIGGLVAGAGSTAVDAAASIGGAEAGAAPEMLSGMDMAADASSGFAGPVAAGGSGIIGDSMTAAAVPGDSSGVIGSAMQSGVGPDLAVGTPASAGVDAAAVQTPAGSTGAGTSAVTPGTAPSMVPGSPNAAGYNPAMDSQAANNAITASGGNAHAAYGAQPSASFMDRIMGVFTNPSNKTVLELGAKVAGGALQGMQQQSMFNEKMGLERDRLKQTSFGSQVGQNRPHGIVNGARA